MAKFWDFLKGDKRSTDPSLSLSTFQQMFGATGRFPAYSSSRGKSSEAPPTDFGSYAEKLFAANPVVFAAMTARLTSFSEVRFQFQRMRNGRPGDLFGTRELEILETPWVGGSTSDLLSRAIQDVDLAGNFYAVRAKESNKTLRRLRPDWVVIEMSADFDVAERADIVGYSYHPGGIGYAATDQVRTYNPDEVVHWAPLPDPTAQWRGMSWLTPVMREIMADSAASVHKLKYFENAATPNLAVSMKDTTEEEFEAFANAFESSHRGVEHAYETLYLGGGADVTVVGADMKQMDFRSVTGVSEARICAASRTPAAIVGISEGIQQGSFNQSVLRAAKDLFGDGTIRPLWRSFASALNSIVQSPKDARLWYDDSDVSFFRDDKIELAQIKTTEASTLNGLLQAGWTHESSVEAIKNGGDWTLLEHSELYSVQLQAPNSGHDPEKAAADIAQVQAATIATLSVTYEADSVVQAVIASDWSLLVERELEPTSVTPPPFDPDAEPTEPNGARPDPIEDTEPAKANGEPLPSDKDDNQEKGMNPADGQTSNVPLGT